MTNNPTITESGGPPAIAAAPTSIALFVGWAPSGPTGEAVRIASLADYEAAFGQLADERSLLGYAVGHFFDNGGTDAFALRVVGDDAVMPNDAAFVQALSAAFAAGAPVEKIDAFNLICVPGLTDTAAIAMLQGEAAARRAFLIADCAENATVASFPAALAAITGGNAANSALYFPWVLAPDQLQNGTPLRAFPPCGFVAGVYARTDIARGVWHPPAGMDANVVDAMGMTVRLFDADESQLNPLGVNCLRGIPRMGYVIWGARTLASAAPAAQPEWKYVNLRRLAIFMADSIDNGTKWAVFEPNGAMLWARLRASIDAFMFGLWEGGAFKGSTAPEAYFVKCDTTTTTPDDVERGVVNIVIGYAPMKPAEFVIMSIALRAALPS
jgi:hypothetical protein